MTAENIKIKKRVLNDIERSYELTLSDIARYKRQAGSITIDVVKRLIRWNYFRNTNPVQLWSYTSNDENYFIVAMDMFDLQLWLVETYNLDTDILNDIEEELIYYSTIVVPKF